MVSSDLYLNQFQQLFTTFTDLWVTCITGNVSKIFLRYGNTKCFGNLYDGI